MSLADLPIFVVSGFPHRRPALMSSLEHHGVTPDRINFIDAPTGHGWQEVPEAGPPSPYWRDNQAPRLITHGEQNCTTGHVLAWQRIVECDTPAIVLEDDISALRPLPEAWPDWCRDVDLLYLGYKLMGDWPEDDAASEWRRPPFLWWACGYAVHPAGARILLDSARESLWIPNDEFIPWHCGLGMTENRNGLVKPAGEPGRLRPWAAGEPYLEPSFCEASETAKPDPAFELHVVLFGTDAARLERPAQAWRDAGFAVTSLGVGKPGWDTSREGGREKMEWLRDWLREQSTWEMRTTIVLALDGYDTALLPETTPSDVMATYGSLRWPCIVSGERNYWPKRGLENHFAPRDYGDDGGQGGTSQPYHYPCSGVFIGPAADILHSLDQVLDAYPGERDDQALMHRLVLACPQVWRVDDGAALAMSLMRAEDDVGADGVNRVTGTRPLIYHANSDSRLPAHVTGVADYCGGSGAHPLLYGHPVPIMHLPHDMFLIPLLSPAAAEELAAEILRLDGWGVLDGDAVPGDELRGAILDPLKALIENHVMPLLNAALTITSPVTQVKDIFAIRHSADRQRTLRLHTDISAVSGSIKLRDAARGGDLLFPRQGWSDAHMEPGCSVWWPSAVTHPHTTIAVENGVRLAVTVWT